MAQGTTEGKAAIIGAGAWGTAIAAMLARGGWDAQLWAREAEVVTAINETHENSVFLSGVALPETLRATDDFAACLAGADVLFMVTPAQHMRAICSDMLRHVAPGTQLFLCSKGVERETAAFMTDVIREALPQAKPGVISGPTFAHEVAKGLPGAVTLACSNLSEAQAWCARIGQATFRPYASDDLIGAEVGGAIKNILAIACGIVDGRGLGENARAAVITRGMAEMLRFGEAHGARSETLMGLCGLGDLILTCSSRQSRNMSLGVALGEGQKAADILKSRKTVAEGALSAAVVAQWATNKGITMPIVNAVDKVVNDGLSVDEAIEALINRPFTVETK
ncbi:MAG: NAD(P)H-dependent glycerol-3-phosphate dehydrogenase [Pseudomonadota bacterium]